MSLDYAALRRLEDRMVLAVRKLESAAQVIDDECCDECCAQHGADEVSEALKAVKGVRTTIAAAMLDALRDEQRDGSA